MAVDEAAAAAATEVAVAAAEADFVLCERSLRGAPATEATSAEAKRARTAKRAIGERKLVLIGGVVGEVRVNDGVMSARLCAGAESVVKESGYAETSGRAK